MKTVPLMAAFLTLAPVPAVAQQIHDMRERIGLRSEAVIRQELIQTGFEPESITIQEGKARVEIRFDGSPAVLEIDRLSGGYRVLSATPTLRARIEPLLKPPVVILPDRLPSSEAGDLPEAP